MYKKSLPIGIEDFKKLIEEECYYVDKTEIISELVENKSQIKLFARPRRFGKTITMSMIEYFFSVKEKEENRKLFLGLNIEKNEIAMKEFGKNPVLNISFKGIKGKNFKELYEDFKDLVSMLYEKNSEVKSVLSEFETKLFSEIVERKAEEIDVRKAIFRLSMYIERYYKEKVIILLDEYDYPIDTAYNNGAYNQTIDFFKSMFGWTFKGNSSLKFAVLTGVLKVTSESLFSEFNNPKIYTILNKEFNEYFGFTECEVKELLKYYELEENFVDVKNWYDGYNIGGKEIYNPWSILNYAESGELKPYWVNTGSLNTISSLVRNNTDELKKDLLKILNEEQVILELDENLSYKELNTTKNNILNLLLMSGYLTTKNESKIDDMPVADLRVPNKEIRLELKRMIKLWFEQTSTMTNLIRFKEAVLTKDLEALNVMLNDILQKQVSYHDTEEKFYHGLILRTICNIWRRISS